MSATTSRPTPTAPPSASAIPTLPPIECPSTAHAPTPSASSVSATSPAIAA